MTENTNSKTTSLVTKVFNYFLTFALFSMVMMVFTNAVLRYVKNTGITQVEELARYFFIWTVFLGTVAAFADKRHVGVTLLVDHLKGNAKKALRLIGYGAMLYALVIMLQGGLAYTQTSASSLGPATNIPFSYMSVSLVVAAVLMMIIIVKDIFNLFKKEKEE